MWGVSVGALAYRYGMLPLDWSSPLKHVLPGAAIGLAVGAGQLVKGQERPPLPILLALGLAGAALAFALSWLAFPTLERARLETKQFPGFALAIPSGEVVEDSTTDYAAGKLTLKRIADGSGVFVTQWEPGTPMTPDELKVIAEVMGTAIGQRGEASLTRIPGPGDNPVDTIVFGGEDATFTLSMLTCGVRNVLVATGAASLTMTLQTRIVASFQCKADPDKEATARVAFPLVIDLPGWYEAEREIDQFQITDGLTGNLTMRTVRHDNKIELAKVIEPMFRAAGVDVQIGVEWNGRIPLTMTAEGETMVGWAQLVPCPTGKAMVR